MEEPGRGRKRNKTQRAEVPDRGFPANFFHRLCVICRNLLQFAVIQPSVLRASRFPYVNRGQLRLKRLSHLSCQSPEPKKLLTLTYIKHDSPRFPANLKPVTNLESSAPRSSASFVSLRLSVDSPSTPGAGGPANAAQSRLQALATDH